MMMLKQVALLALAGTAIAAPAAQNWAGHYPAGAGGWWWNGPDGNNVEAPSTTTSTPAAETPAPVASSAPAAAAPASSSSSSSSSSSASTDGYMGVVNKWRLAGGLSSLTQDSKLEGNAAKTATDSNYDATKKMTHELNSGSMAQVLAPGDSSDFESVYVGGWLCEVPNLPGLNGICSSMAQGWDHSNGETGHADILTSKSYSNIGCALVSGLWACDLS